MNINIKAEPGSNVQFSKEPIINNTYIQGDYVQHKTVIVQNGSGSTEEAITSGGLTVDNLFTHPQGIKDVKDMWLLLVAAEAWKVTFDNLPKFNDWAFENFDVPFDKEKCKSKLQEKLKGQPWSNIHSQDDMIKFIKEFRSQVNVLKADKDSANAIFLAIKEICLGEK